ncbi:MAG: hypothetical protein CVV17_09130 [Gammaproteobacteria bacterium HGW-Gammaproteobacteria-7]|nr:MAG: hypothetical protein CVV17_09130 [Gammaproteobacteria bacterium HGW-Gammaproteobacteria-7]
MRGTMVSACLLLGACFWRESPQPDRAPSSDDVDYASVAIAWLSPAAPGDELDSLAGCNANDIKLPYLAGLLICPARQGCA